MEPFLFIGWGPMGLIPPPRPPTAARSADGNDIASDDDGDHDHARPRTHAQRRMQAQGLDIEPNPHLPPSPL